jgi:hypothetical protein
MTPPDRQPEAAWSGAQSAANDLFPRTSGPRYPGFRRGRAGATDPVGFRASRAVLRDRRRLGVWPAHIQPIANFAADARAKNLAAAGYVWVQAPSAARGPFPTDARAAPSRLWAPTRGRAKNLAAAGYAWVQAPSAARGPFPTDARAAPSRLWARTRGCAKKLGPRETRGSADHARNGERHQLRSHASAISDPGGVLMGIVRSGGAWAVEVVLTLAMRMRRRATR